MFCLVTDVYLYPNTTWCILQYTNLRRQRWSYSTSGEYSSPNVHVL